MIQNPSSSDVGDADSSVFIADFAEGGEESLEEGPRSPSYHYHVKILKIDR